MAYAYDADEEDDLDRMEDEAEDRAPSDLIERMGEVEGDVSDLLEEGELATIASRAIEEFDADKSGRREWDEIVRNAIESAKMAKEEKGFPFKNAANVRYPALPVASIQFGSRAYGAMVRDDQVVKSKVFGADKDGRKAAQGERVSSFCNWQLLHLCDEWDPGTDQLCHMLPVHGKMFRKIYWSRARNRPVLDTVSSLNVYTPMNAPSLDQAPRVTQICEYFPYEIAQRIAAGVWRNHDYVVDSADTQKPILYLEQYRYEDLDRDGLPEPYVATIHRDTATVVRLEPAFDPEHLRVWESGAGDALVRDLPWVDYGFLPNPEGGFYEIGFGHLLEGLGAAINAILNQIIDAGTRANAGGGFISAGLKLRAGTIRINPGEFQPVNVQGDIRGAIHEMQFSGPNQTQFQVLEFLLGAAQDITATKDVLTGEMPGQQRLAEGTVLALIEQGMQVYSTIYKRIYRSERRAHRRLFGLNRDFVDAKVYQQFLDTPADPRADFDMRGVDVMPVSDPSSVTDMQRLARANFLASRVQAAPDLYDRPAVEARILESARVPNANELMQQSNGAAQMLQMKGAEAKISETNARARHLEASAAKTYQEAQSAALERGVRAGELDAVVPNAGDPPVLPGAGGDGGPAQGDLG